MKNVLIAAIVAGVAGAALVLYLSNNLQPSSEADDIADAADDAYKTMNRSIGSVERGTERAFDSL